ncbi:MAG: hypothetical protein ABIP93_12665 [Gemmatimonadaceae bacterium]
MTNIDRTFRRNILQQERVVAVAFRLIVAAILLLVLLQIGAAVSGLSSNFTGVVSSVG